MAANIMVEVLKQMQQDLTDQKDYMRNINEKLSKLNGKVDQQQVTLERLEQHVIKNNKLLFGNDDTDVNIKELSLMLYKPESNDNRQANLVENDAASQQEKTSITDDVIHTRDGDKVEEPFAEEPVEMKEEHEVESPVQEETARISSSYLNIEYINQLHVDLKQIMLKISIIKESIGESGTARKTPVDVTSDQMSKNENVQVSPTCFNSEQVNQLNGELKQIMTKMIEIKKLMKETIVTEINPVDEPASPVCKQETVQLCLNYLSTDQIRKLNGELKQITEKYQSTNIFPVVELIPGPALDNIVMKSLSRGLLIGRKKGTDNPQIHLKLGLNGFKRSVVQDLIAEYPNFNVHDVIQEVLTSRNEWTYMSSNYNLNDLSYL